MEEQLKQRVDKLVAEQMPRIKSQRDVLTVVSTLCEYCDELNDKEPKHQELYKYLNSALDSLMQQRLQDHELDPEDIEATIALAFCVGRMVESHIGLLEGMKKKLVMELGLMTREDIEGSLRTSAAPTNLLEMLKAAGIQVNVIDLSKTQSGGMDLSNLPGPVAEALKRLMKK